ncbi:hypothetical protein VTK26DRAFT_4211 [Humicola hyalothermophila]
METQKALTDHDTNLRWDISLISRPEAVIVEGMYFLASSSETCAGDQNQHSLSTAPPSRREVRHRSRGRPSRNYCFRVILRVADEYTTDSAVGSQSSRWHQPALAVGQSVVGLGLALKVFDAVSPKRRLVLGKAVSVVGLVKELSICDGIVLGLVSISDIAEKPRHHPPLDKGLKCRLAFPCVWGGPFVENVA